MSLISETLASLDRRITEFDPDRLAGFDVIEGSEEARLSSIGVTLSGSRECVFLVEDDKRPLGRIAIHNRRHGNIFCFGGAGRTDESIMNIRLLGERVCVILPELGPRSVNINDLFMRSSEQVFFWGRDATSVGTIFELEGKGKRIVCGDDCMFSSDVNVRNHDMHSIFDIETGEIVNRAPDDIIVERHVWVGYRAMLFACGRVGAGSIVGANSFLNRPLPPYSLAVGNPAKAIRSGVSWSRPVRNVPPDILAHARADRERLAGETRQDDRDI